MYPHVIQTTMASSTGIGGRVDIAIRPDTSGRILPVFWLESKVGSPLTHKQIEKYKKNGLHRFEYSG